MRWPAAASLVLALALAGAAAAQDSGSGGADAGNTALAPGDPGAAAPDGSEVGTAIRTANGTGAVVRWLDKVSGQTVDLEIGSNMSQEQGRLTITVRECRYPQDDPTGDAFAYLVIRDTLVQTPIFEGWMIASAPALDPLDSSRYDVWVLRCTTS